MRNGNSGSLQSGLLKPRSVKSASPAAGRLQLNADESTEERIESSRRLWSAHHQDRYAKENTIPTVSYGIKMNNTNYCYQKLPKVLHT